MGIYKSTIVRLFCADIQTIFKMTVFSTHRVLNVTVLHDIINNV